MKTRIHDKWKEKTGRRIYPKGSKTVNVELIKENQKTVLVRYDEKIIKRHKIKHQVEMENNEN